MYGPFHDNVKAGVSGTPGTGTITMGAASTGCRAWSNVPAKQVVWYRAVEGAGSEIGLGYWNGTTLTRNLLHSSYSTTGAKLNLTSAATVELTIPALDAAASAGRVFESRCEVQFGDNAVFFRGMYGADLRGTRAAVSWADTNFLTRQPRCQFTSGTAAGDVAGLHANGYDCSYSTVAGQGGFDYRARWGASQIPTGGRLFVGFYPAGLYDIDPSGLTSIICFGKDSADTNISFMTRGGSGSVTKTDTGIALAANGWYESRLICPPGGGIAYGILIRLDTGEIWCGNSTTNLPSSGQGLGQFCVGYLGTVTGTAIIFHVGGTSNRLGPI